MYFMRREFDHHFSFGNSLFYNVSQCSLKIRIKISFNWIKIFHFLQKFWNCWSPNTSVIGATLLLEVAFRAFLYGSHANFISVLYPSYSFGSLYGIRWFNTDKIFYEMSGLNRKWIGESKIFLIMESSKIDLKVVISGDQKN